jgi:peptidoglycan/LPS O-acetylase OafA/YrhL
MSKIKYESHIDGLRGLSVLAVLIYHSQINLFNIQLLKGGYLGVDVFFIISGYLISKIIYTELFIDKNFSLLNFFKRRIRRIIPSLFFIILVFLVLSYFFLLPWDIIFLAKQALSQLAFVSNFFFWKYLNFSYMADESLLIPFLHTWSLSVEQQFYLFFPIFILFFYKFFFKYLITFFLILITISLITAHFFSYSFPSFNFYTTTSRIWEFLMGSLFAYFNIKNKKIYFLELINQNVITIFSLIFLLCSFIFFDERTKHPSFITLIPALSTIFLLYFSKENCLALKILSYKPFVNLGIISYSLYLWHYPIFAFFRKSYFANFYNHNLMMFIMIILSFILSITTYNLIEKRFKLLVKNFNITLLFIILFLISIIFFSVRIIKTNGYQERLDLSDFQKSYFQIENKIPIQKKTPNQNSNIINKNKIYILGNSHGDNFKDILISNSKITEHSEINNYNIQISSLENFIKSGSDKSKHFLHQIINKNIIKNKHKEMIDSDIIFLKSRIGKDDIPELSKVIKIFKNMNKKVVLFSTSIEVEINSQFTDDYFQKPETILKKNMYSNLLYFEKFILKENRMPNKEEANTISKQYFKSIKPYIKNINKELEEIAKKNNILFVDLNDIICDNKNNQCIFLTDSDKLIIEDNSGHLTNAGIIYLSKNFDLQKKIMDLISSKEF